MELIILFLAVIAALLVIASGIWVGIALVSAIFTRRSLDPAQGEGVTDARYREGKKRSG